MARAARRRMLAAMEGYCLTCDCLRGYMLRCFGDQAVKAPAASENALASSPAAGSTAGSSVSAPESTGSSGSPVFTCHNCSNCEGGFTPIDVTAEARAVMRCVKELRGRFGKGVVVDVLRGTNVEKLEQLGLTHAQCFNTVSMSQAQLKEVVELLAAGEYLEITEGQYPLVGYGPRFREAAMPEFRMNMKQVVRQPARQFGGKRLGGHSFGGSGTASGPDAAYDQDLFERLRKLRKQLAIEEGLAPYMVFGDATLRDMCARLPQTDDEFLDVSGVGLKKLEKYGKTFMDEIAAYRNEVQ